MQGIDSKRFEKVTGIKTLLVYPPFLDHKSEYPPLGIGYIGAVLRKENFEVDAIDLSVFNPNEWKEKISTKIENFDPEIIGISAMTSIFNSALKVGEYVKKNNPKTKIVFGGHHPTIYPERTLQHPFIDFVVRCEGEITFLELVKSLEIGGDLKNIKGLSFKNNEKIIHNQDRELIQNLDELPFPLRDCFDLESYPLFPEINLITSRGCPYNCYFCFKGLFGHKFRARTPENVIDEIEYLDKNYDLNKFYFYDDLFTFDKNRVKRICELILKKNLDIKWKCLSRVNTIDNDLLKKMKEAGCTVIHYGIETGDPMIMKKIKKMITLEQVKEAMKLTRKNGIESKAFFMVGHPWDTKDTIERTIQFSKDINTDKAHFSLTTPLPSTELWDIAKSMGIVNEDILDWDRLVLLGKNVNPVMRTYELSSQDLKDYQIKAEREWYRHKTLYLLHHPIELIKVLRRKGVAPLTRIILRRVIK